MENMNMTAAMKEVEQIAAQFGENSWQAEKTVQMTSDPKGQYFAKIAALRREQDEKELNILKGSKNVFEYGFWMDKARALYHKARYEALVVYMRELGLKVPTKYGELVLPEKPKNLFFKKKGKKKNCWQPISDFSVDAAYAHYMGVA